MPHRNSGTTCQKSYVRARYPSWRRLVVAVAASVLLCDYAKPGSPASSVGALESAFLSANKVAMAKMMKAMIVQPSRSIDRDFANLMIPHHEGAIEMAQAELLYGSNEQLRRLAQEIIIDQQQEIAAMRLALGDVLPPSAPASTQVTPMPSLPAPDTRPSLPSVPAMSKE